MGTVCPLIKPPLQHNMRQMPELIGTSLKINDGSHLSLNPSAGLRLLYKMSSDFGAEGMQGGDLLWSKLQRLSPTIPVVRAELRLCALTPTPIIVNTCLSKHTIS